MNKIIVIGICGSGKTYLSNKLQEITNIPVYHLDAIFWNKDKTFDRSRLNKRIREIIKTDNWIIDGHYTKTMEERVNACDTIIYLDLPLSVCIAGINKRSGIPRTDLPWTESKQDCNELIEYCSNIYQNRDKVYALLKSYPDKNLIVLKSREEVNNFIEKVSRETL